MLPARAWSNPARVMTGRFNLGFPPASNAQYQSSGTPPLETPPIPYYHLPGL
ncbi:MAG: hypothetical protein ACOY4Q_00760 [Bacillota bacterium]